jgi:hypothetical protein
MIHLSSRPDTLAVVQITDFEAAKTASTYPFWIQNAGSNQTDFYSSSRPHTHRYRPRRHLRPAASRRALGASDSLRIAVGQLIHRCRRIGPVAIGTGGLPHRTILKGRKGRGFPLPVAGFERQALVLGATTLKFPSPRINSYGSVGGPGP